jgi:hypothetical protein
MNAVRVTGTLENPNSTALLFRMAIMPGVDDCQVAILLVKLLALNQGNAVLNWGNPPVSGMVSPTGPIHTAGRKARSMVIGMEAGVATTVMLIDALPYHAYIVPVPA